MKKVRLFAGSVILLVLLTACGGGGLAGAADEMLAGDAELQDELEMAEEEIADEDSYDALEAQIAELEPYVVDGATYEPAAPPAEEQAAPPETDEQTSVEDIRLEDYGASPFFDASRDPLSTFSIDVDTGSYSIARNYLLDGQLPPRDTVRPEEFINYFDQGYDYPQAGAFNIEIDGAPNPFVNGPGYVLRVGVQGYDVPASQRPDANLVFVIDVSGSMSDYNKLPAVKQALYSLLDNLRPTDTVSIVVYSSRASVILEPTPVRREDSIRRAIDGLEPGGSTYAEDGLRLGYQMASQNFDRDNINRVILLSDGVANVGATGPDAILDTVRRQARDGITLTSVGFGMGTYNDMLMEQLADNGDGEYFYVDSHEEARRVFVDDLTGTLLTIAFDAKIQVEFYSEAVAYYRLIGYENRDIADEDFRNDRVDAGEIGAGHNVTALYEIIPMPGMEGPLATVHLRYQDAESGRIVELAESFGSDSFAPTFDRANPYLKLTVATAAFAEVLADVGWAEVASMQEIWPLTVDAASDMPEDEDVQEFVLLLGNALTWTR